VTLKTVPVNSGQNVHNWRNGKAFAEAARKLYAENKLVQRGEAARKNSVEIVNKFVAKLPYGEKEKAREALCKSAGIVRRTFTRWQSEIDQREAIGPSLYEKAEEMDYDFTPSSISNLAKAKELNPGKTPEEIVRKAMNGDAPTKAKAARFQEPETTPVQLLEDTVCKYMQDTNDDVDGLFEVLKAQVSTNKLCAALKGLKCP
jgi:hypothetical protein